MDEDDFEHGAQLSSGQFKVQLWCPYHKVHVATLYYSMKGKDKTILNMDNDYITFSALIKRDILIPGVILLLEGFHYIYL